MKLHDVGVYKHIDESECSLQVAVVHETPYFLCSTPSSLPKLFFPLLHDSRSDAGGARC